LETVDPYDVLLLLVTSGATWDQEPVDPTPTSAPLVSGWNTVCYAGETQDTEAATEGMAGKFAIVYTLAPGQTWNRFVPDRPEVSNLDRLDRFTAVLVLVTDDNSPVWVFEP
jgi:hypothetical protein